jgi:hypothetical protein
MLLGGPIVAGCPLYNEHRKMFSLEIRCEATDEDLKYEQELTEGFCQADYRRCLRYQTYQDLKIEFLVRKKLQSEYGT